MVSSGIIALLKQPRRKLASTLAIGSLGFSLLLSLIAFAHVLRGWAHGAAVRETVSFTWLQFGHSTVDLGWVLDPLAAVMLVMVSFVGLLIFIYSVGYMAHDENFTRFFCFMSLFAGAMLGVVISNSLLLLFMCWEIVGLTSYLLIGFWYQKPAAAAAAKKAFITTRVGDIFFFLGIVWLFSETGALLFYNHGIGSLEPLSLAVLVAQHAGLGLSAAGAIALLIFAGAVGKSGQLPLHVWLPDAGLRAHSCGNHGRCRRLSRRARLSSHGRGRSAHVDWRAAWWNHCRSHCRHMGGCGHCGLCRAHRRRAK
jgi:NADH-quinone oxidoreductase subunit L